MNINNIYRWTVVLLIMITSIFVLKSKGLSQVIQFSVPYGSEDTQIDMYIPDKENIEGEEASGPSWFFIDNNHNTVYIDFKKYNIAGEFIAKIVPEENQALSGITTCLYLDNEESIYFKGQNRSNKCDQLVKINKEGKIIWIKTLPELVFNNACYESMGEGINIDTQGNIYLEVYFRERPGDDVAKLKYLKIDKNGNYVGEIPDYHIDKHGYYYVFQPSYSNGKLYGTALFGKTYVGSYESGAEINMFNSEQQFVKKININLPDEFKQFENYRGVVQWEVDPEGNIYACASVLRDKDKIEELVGESFSIDTDYIVYKFNQNGELVSQNNFPGYPIDIKRKIQINGNGDIYYLQYYADHLDVVKVTSDNIAPQTNISISPFPNIMNWNNTDVTITLTATDNEGGSGVKEIHYNLTGAANEDKVVPGQTVQIVLQSEGTTNLSYYALDNAGNKDETKSVVLKLDKTAPLVSLNLEPYSIKLPFRYENFNFYAPFFYKLLYSSTDPLSGIKESKTGLITPSINGFKTQLIKGKQLHITLNVDKKHLIITAANPQQVLEQLKNNLLLIDNNQIMHLNQRPRAKVYTITKTDKFLVIFAPSIVFKAAASDNADNLAVKELKYEKKKMPLPDYCKLMINKKEFSLEEIEDLMEDMNIDADTLKGLLKNYNIK